jgi:anti-sigma factor ChrR (cupin superfamily)
LEKRQIIETKEEGLLAYNRYGKVTSGLKWLPLSKDEKLEHEVFIIRFEADSSSNLHRHNGCEEFYVLDGELIDDDGEVFKKGDYIKFEKGSEHASYSKTGCTLLVILYGGKNELIHPN